MMVTLGGEELAGSGSKEGRETLFFTFEFQVMDSIMYYFNGNQSFIVCEKKMQVREEESCEVEFEFWIYQYEIMIFQKKIAEGVKQ